MYVASKQGAALGWGGKPGKCCVVSCAFVVTFVTNWNANVVQSCLVRVSPTARLK